MADELTPIICPCACTCDFLSKFDPNIYDVESTDTFLKAFFDVVCIEFCDIAYELQMTKNDFYLWKDMPEEVIVKGEAYGVDCFDCKAVVDIISIGDTPGASDYIEDIDFEVHQCGVKWLRPYSYYGSYYTPTYYGVDYGSTGPFYVEAKQPETGMPYYVTYRCGVRNDKLYDNFGVMVDLVKKDYQSYSDYREAIKALIVAYLAGPTIDSMLDALSIFTNRSNIYIEEGYTTGWILDESFLYSKAQYADPTVYTGDGTILYQGGENFVFDVYVYNSETVSDQTLFTDIVNKLKPAHTLAYVHFV